MIIRPAALSDLPEVRLLTSNLVRKDAHRFYQRLGFRGTHLGMKLSLT